MSHFSPGFIGGGGLDQYTKMLLHFDNDLVDLANPSRVFTQRAAGTSFTSSSKFGSHALNCGAAAGYIDTPDEATFTYGSADFTIDCWINVQGGSGATRFLFGQSDASNTLSTYSVQGVLVSTNVIRAVAVIGGTNYNADSTGTITSAGWHHYAAVRSGDTLKCALDGVFGSSTALPAGGVINNSANNFAIGNVGQYQTVPLYMNGFIDEFRISPGIARWTSGFTPPTSPY